MNSFNSNLHGNSPAYLRTLHTARMVAATDAPVLISGERGVGKSTLAGEIHAVSVRRNRPLLRLGCTGVSREDLEGILQGEKALDGGVALDAAAGGSLLLDEVSELAEESQSLLMRFLEAGCRGLNLRIISTTSRDLAGLVQQGAFREDLYYRLLVVPVEVPPLRERSEDLVPLLKQFSRDLARQHKRSTPRFSVSARNLMKGYHWPGNLRELRNTCEQMVILQAGKNVQPDDLPLEIRRGATRTQVGRLFQLPAGGLDLLEVEGDMIRQALEMSGGNRSRAARLLGLTRDTLLYRIQKHAIEQ
jgi:DNA-binding NtrC family response regulator